MRALIQERSISGLRRPAHHTRGFVVTVLDSDLLDGDGKEKSAETFVFTRGGNAALKSFRTAWEASRERAKLIDIRFHDLRSEYASRLVERGIPLSQVRELLGHCSIVVTERYDRQVLATLKEAVSKLDDGRPFKILQDQMISSLL